MGKMLVDSKMVGRFQCALLKAPMRFSHSEFVWILPCHVLYILNYLFRWFEGNIECVLFAHVLMIFNECQCACSFVCSAFHTICANESVDGVRNMIVQLRAFDIRCDGNDIPIPVH